MCDFSMCDVRLDSVVTVMSSSPPVSWSDTSASLIIPESCTATVVDPDRLGFFLTYIAQNYAFFTLRPPNQGL